MKRFDENDVAKRLGEPAPPPPPDLAARLKAGIPERVEVPPALTRPAAGTLPFLRRPLGRRLVALAAVLVVGIVANLVARRVIRPPASPLEVALIESAPTPEGKAAAPVADAAAPSLQETAPPAQAPAAADRLGKSRREAAPMPAATRPAARQVVADAVVATAEAPAEVVVGGVAAPMVARTESPESDRLEARAAGGAPAERVATAQAPPDEAAEIYRVGGPVVAPELERLVESEYPEAARRAGARGEVVIEAVIDRAGMVVKPRIVRNMTGSPECAEAALDAVRKWRYRPASLEGRPVAVTMTLTVVFEPGRAAPATATPTP